MFNSKINFTCIKVKLDGTYTVKWWYSLYCSWMSHGTV